MAIDPKSRGLEDEESPEKEIVQSKSSDPGKIIKVLGAGKGWIHVQTEDGSEWKRSDGTKAWKNNNPGNIRYGEYARKYGAIGQDDSGMSVFPTVEHGRKAHYDLVFTPIRGYDKLSLIKAIQKYAPDYDGNDSTGYAHYVAKYAKVSYLKVLGTMTTSEKNLVIEAMGKMEGWKVGTVGKVIKK